MSSVGWIAGNTLSKKESKAIELVDDASSIIGLKAVLYESETGVRTTSSTHACQPERTRQKFSQPKGLIESSKVISKSNLGVDERNAKDWVRDQAEQTWASTALARKAEIYEAIRKGDAIADGKCFLVDFEQKNWDAQDNGTGWQPVEGAVTFSNKQMKRERSALVAETTMRITHSLTAETPTVIVFSHASKNSDVNAPDSDSRDKSSKWDNLLTAEEKNVLTQLSVETQQARLKRKGIDQSKQDAMALKRKKIAEKNAASAAKKKNDSEAN